MRPKTPSQHKPEIDRSCETNQRHEDKLVGWKPTENLSDSLTDEIVWEKMNLGLLYSADNGDFIHVCDFLGEPTRIGMESQLLRLQPQDHADPSNFRTKYIYIYIYQKYVA